MTNLGESHHPSATLKEGDMGGLGFLGILMIVVGALAIVVGFVFDVGVETAGSDTLGILPTRVANIDRLSIREMIVAVGGYMFVAGWIAFSADKIRRSLVAK